MKKAYVLMNCQLGYEKDVITSLYYIDSVKEVHGILGLYDIIAKLESDEEAVQRDLTTKIRKLLHTSSTMTLMSTEEENIFKNIAVENPFTPTSQACVVMYCDRGFEYNVLRSLVHIPEVIEADVVYGYYDIVCKVGSESYNELEKVITKKLRSLDHVRTSMTLQIIPEQEAFIKFAKRTYL